MRVYSCLLALLGVRDRLARIELALLELAELYPLILVPHLNAELALERNRLKLAEQLLAAAFIWYRDQAEHRSSRGLNWPPM